MGSLVFPELILSPAVPSEAEGGVLIENESSIPPVGLGQTQLTIMLPEGPVRLLVRENWKGAMPTPAVVGDTGISFDGKELKVTAHTFVSQSTRKVPVSPFGMTLVAGGVTLQVLA